MKLVALLTLFIASHATVLPRAVSASEPTPALSGGEVEMCGVSPYQDGQYFGQDGNVISVIIAEKQSAVSKKCQERFARGPMHGFCRIESHSGDRPCASILLRAFAQDGLTAVEFRTDETGAFRSTCRR